MILVIEEKIGLYGISEKGRGKNWQKFLYSLCEQISSGRCQY